VNQKVKRICWYTCCSWGTAKPRRCLNN